MQSLLRLSSRLLHALSNHCLRLTYADDHWPVLHSSCYLVIPQSSREDCGLDVGGPGKHSLDMESSVLHRTSRQHQSRILHQCEEQHERHCRHFSSQQSCLKTSICLKLVCLLWHTRVECYREFHCYRELCCYSRCPHCSNRYTLESLLHWRWCTGLADQTVLL